MNQLKHFKRVVERLREMERNVRGKDSGFGFQGQRNSLILDTGHPTPSLSPETLRELDSFFLEQILSTPELNERERGEVIEYYLKTENSSVLLRTA